MVTNDLIVELRKTQSLLAIQNIDMYAKRSAVRNLNNIGKLTKDELLFICDLFYSVQFYSQDPVRDRIDFSKFCEILAKMTTWANFQEVDRNELQTALSENPVKASIGIQFLTNMFNKHFDTDNDGHINLQDLVSGLAKLVRTDVVEVLKTIFSAHDKDDDGLLTREECIQMSETFLFLQRKNESDRKLGSVSSFINRAFMINLTAESEKSKTDDFKLTFDMFKELITADDFLLNYFSDGFGKTFTLLDSNTGVQQTVYAPPMSEITGNLSLTFRILICWRS